MNLFTKKPLDRLIAESEGVGVTQIETQRRQENDGLTIESGGNVWPASF